MRRLYHKRQATMVQYREKDLAYRGCLVWYPCCSRNWVLKMKQTLYGMDKALRINYIWVFGSHKMYSCFLVPADVITLPLERHVKICWPLIPQIVKTTSQRFLLIVFMVISGFEHLCPLKSFSCGDNFYTIAVVLLSHCQCWSKTKFYFLDSIRCNLHICHVYTSLLKVKIETSPWEMWTDSSLGTSVPTIFPPAHFNVLRRLSPLQFLFSLLYSF